MINIMNFMDNSRAKPLHSCNAEAHIPIVSGKIVITGMDSCFSFSRHLITEKKLF